MELKSASWRNIPEHNIFTIPRINKHKAQTLASEGIYNIADIPDNFELSDAQDNYVKLIESGKPDINKVAIQDKLDELNFPLNFVDFETYMSALPFVPNTRIFEQVPFQYHYFLLESNGEISEANHVSADIERVREDFLESLLDVLLDNDGSIIAYNIRFEIGILKKLSFKYPEYSNDIESIIGRFWDLENVFRHYKDPGFLGRTSLKNVLPVIVPNMSYDNLDIIEGKQAGIIWEEMLLIEDENAKKEMMRKLVDYCYQDTFGMVQIYEYLKHVLSDSSTEQTELPW